MSLKVVRSTLDAGKAGHCPHIPSPLMYEWHGTQYLGAAHGVAGILTVLLQVEWVWLEGVWLHVWEWVWVWMWEWVWVWMWEWVWVWVWTWEWVWVWMWEWVWVWTWEWAVDACVASSVGMGVGDVVANLKQTELEPVRKCLQCLEEWIEQGHEVDCSWEKLLRVLNMLQLHAVPQ